MDEPTSVHWHGINAPYIDNANDGVPAVGAGRPIEAGKRSAYHWTAPPAGTYWYHSHMNVDHQVMLGLYGPIIVRPKDSSKGEYAYDDVWMFSEWRVNKDKKGNVIGNVPAMAMEGMLPNYFTINGKAFDPVCLDTPNAPSCKNHGNIIVKLRGGDKARIRLITSGQDIHAMHMHGRNFKVIARDSVPLPPHQQAVMNTITVHPGEIVDIEFTAGNTPEDIGAWVFHCHVLHHAANDHSYPGGLISAIVITN